VPRAEVADWLRAADLFVHPSGRLANGRTEGAPIAAREAQAVGIPVVVTNEVGVLARAIAALALHGLVSGVTGASAACNGIRTSEA
jgi:glycosyltransferase involved in cell wall biosynthesis